jgi:hypothetical protein
MKNTIGALTAAVALGAAGAQVNAQSLFAPSGPVVGSPLGGGVLNNIGFGAGANTGFGSFNTAFNSRFILPMNANFNSQLASFNTQRGFNTNLLDYNARLAQFNTDRTNTANQFSQFNSALNVPSANFSTPNPQLFPSTANLISSNGTLINPSISPLAINNSSSLGFNAFNTFNPVTAGAVNFGSAGVPPAAQMQNFVRVTRTKPAYSPTLPNPPASPYPTAAEIAAANQMYGAQATASNLNVGLPPVGSNYRVPLATQPINGFIALPPVGSNFRAPLMTQATSPFAPLPPVGSNYRIPLVTQTTNPFAPLPPVGSNFRIPLGASASAFGTGAVVMGGRTAR